MKKFIISERVLEEIKEIFTHFIGEGFLDVCDLEMLEDLKELEETE